MVLADILEQNDVLPQLSERVVVGDALIEIHGAVFVVMQDDERGPHLVGMERRRVSNVGVIVLNEVALEAALARLEYPLIGAAGVPVDRAVHAHQVGERRAGDGRVEHVRLRHEERRLIAAPRVAPETDPGRIDNPGRDGGAHRGEHAPHGRHPGIVDFVDDVRIEHRVPATRVDAPVRSARLTRRRIRVEQL